MWPFKRKPQQRKREVRKSEREQVNRWQKFRQAGGLGATLIGLGLFVLVLLADAWPLEPFRYRAGEYLDHDVYARVEFKVQSPAETDRQRELAARSVPAVIRLDETTIERIIGQLKDLPAKARAASEPSKLDKSLRDKFKLDSPSDLADFARFTGPAESKLYRQQIKTLVDKLTNGPILVVVDDFSRAYARDSREVCLLRGKRKEFLPKSRLVSISSSDQVNDFLRSVVSHFPTNLRDNILHCLRTCFTSGMVPWRFDAQATSQAEQAARVAVKPVWRSIPAGTKIVSATRTRGLTQSQIATLLAEHKAYIKQQDMLHPLWRVWVLLGRAGMIASVVVLLGLYLYKYNPRIIQNHTRAGSIALLLGLMLLACKFTIVGRVNFYLSIFWIFLGATVLTIAYEQRFALAVAGALVVLIIMQLRVGLTELVVFGLAAAVTIFQLREIRTRSKLIEAGGITAMVIFVLSWAAEAAKNVPAKFTLVDSCYAAGAAIAAGFITQGILPLIERIFRVATSLTLLEWCDANKPLLKRLALEAPGTYNHSLVLGALCESAAEAIGANGLLARVGAYYHDIGKINKPDYFVENQAGSVSKHDRLSPAMSLLVIKGHVKDGLEMAREYGLPRVLWEFIATHHGTTLVEFFYHSASRQREINGQSAPDEVEFRYPGPKPRMKEAAILMLADAAESAIRAIPEPTTGRVEAQVHEIISNRLTDGQLDDCELTLREVHAVETSLVKSLCGMFHARVAYPSQKKSAANKMQNQTDNQTRTGESSQSNNGSTAS